MKQYIDKAALAANIEARYNECLQRAKIIDVEYWNGKADAYRNMLVVLDTIEVKEEAKDVDLDKIINDYFKDWKFDDELDIMVKPNNYSASFADLKEIAKYFFELGTRINNPITATDNR